MYGVVSRRVEEKYFAFPGSSSLSVLRKFDFLRKLQQKLTTHLIHFLCKLKLSFNFLKNNLRGMNFPNVHYQPSYQQSLNSTRPKVCRCMVRSRGATAPKNYFKLILYFTLLNNTFIFVHYLDKCMSRQCVSRQCVFVSIKLNNVLNASVSKFYSI